MTVGIFNSAVFNTPIFNTGGVLVVGGGGWVRWKDETEANARKHILAKALQRKKNQEEQLEKNIKKLQKKAKQEPDAFLQRIEENHRKLLDVREEILSLEFEFSEANDYIDRIISGWSEDEEDEDDWLLLQ